MSNLFRKEAIQHNMRGRLDGSVVLAIPLSVRLLGLFMGLLAAGVVIFAASASYARRETAPGWLTPDQGVLRASALQGGRVESLLVSEGDTVAPGQALARLVLDSDLDDGAAGTRIVAALQMQAAAAREAADAEIARITREAERRGASLEGLRRELRGVIEQIGLQRQEIDLARGQIDRAAGLAERGFLSERELDDRRQRLLAARQSMALLERTRAGLERQISDAEAALQSAPLEIEEARARARSVTASLEERLTQQSLRNAYVVAAPAQARVAALPVRTGQTLTAGAPVAVLVPEGGQLVAELYLPTRAAGFIQSGQEVSLRVEAFPHQRFGTVRARITSVSRTVLAPAEAAIPGLTLQEPVFRVEAALEREMIDAYGQSLPLQPGLLVSADIIIDRRNLIEWLFDPLFAAGRRG
ncbi:HlyD family efflux transporter periplasmic adaptor subunit [Alkalicaulis satelles]|uniref:HlyD family efflux transporter periplasmic adaptor subunit n=1 Tax=Alkalicaulis satelles TaxID=2609175 RepID=A0A5M6ZEY3_9PROT|nr:HlyD family efflux transporter periplasmic adaptor subunit [Alkalicaulis satelles]KAA5802434.1 HlyD family efflux transporter periplasmic adaptor subunit [Alkalicaulis satelles]